MKNLSILGSTGSIGKNVLEIVSMFRDEFTVKGLTAGQNIKLLAEQIKCFKPEIVAVSDENYAKQLKNLIGNTFDKLRIVYGTQGYQEVAIYFASDTVVSAMVGSAGLLPTLAAIENNKNIALANKETLVIAGEIVMERAKQKRVSIMPIDSEHSAIFQCLRGNNRAEVSKIILTASGGPFLNWANSFDTITPENALKHPTWEMGKKISIDSATLMNKGFEVIEAAHLFAISEKQIEVLIHPQSIVHSMVVYQDGSIMAQMGVPDMKTAISYALSFPLRLDLKQALPNFSAIGALTFQQPDMKKFKCLELAYTSFEQGKTYPTVLNAANEVAVNAFLNRRIRFSDIPVLIQKTLEKHKPQQLTLDAILHADSWARNETDAMITCR